MGDETFEDKLKRMFGDELGEKFNKQWEKYLYITSDLRRADKYLQENLTDEELLILTKILYFIKSEYNKEKAQAYLGAVIMNLVVSEVFGPKTFAEIIFFSTLETFGTYKSFFVPRYIYIR